MKMSTSKPKTSKQVAGQVQEQIKTNPFKELCEKIGLGYSDLDDSVSAGRRGEISKRCASLEVSGFHGNNPAIRQVIGVQLDADMRVAPRLGDAIPKDYESLSGGGNGYRKWVGLRDGVYRVAGLAETSGRVVSDYYVICEQKVACIYADSVPDFFEAQHQAALQELEIHKQRLGRAQEISDLIAGERNEYREVVVDDIKATPEFKRFDLNDVMRVLTNESELERFINTASAPLHYIVASPVFAKAATAEAAIEDVKRKIDERAQAQLKAKEEADSLGLPDLKGSERQVSWALQIRAKAYNQNPKDPALKKATTAKYWIENRRNWGN